VARAALGLTLVLAATLLARSAPAETPRTDVRLVIEDCVPGVLNLRQAYAAAALELGLGDTSSTSTTEPGHVELSAVLACDHGVKARLTLKTTDQSAARSVPLDDVRSKDRARVLALALAELVRAEWRWVTTGKSAEAESPPGDERHSTAEPARQTEPTPSPAAAAAGTGAPKQPLSPPTPTNAPRQAAGDRGPPRDAATDQSQDQDLALEVLGRARELFEGPTFAYGAAAGTRFRRWSAGVEALFGRTRGKLGTASDGFADARVGYELVRAARGRWLFGVEPGVAGGVTWLAGTAETPAVKVSNATALYADARLSFRAEFRAPALDPTLSLEAGRALGFAAQENRTTIAVTGGWFAGGALGFVVGKTP